MNLQPTQIDDVFSPQLLTSRDNDLLRHVYRMHLSIPLVIHRVFFPRRTRNAVAQVTGRLVSRRYLNRHRFYRNHVYFTLGPRSAGHFGAPRRRTLPLGEQSLPLQYATLVLCSLYGQGHYQRLLPAELRAIYPWFPPQYLGPHPWCLHEDAAGCRRLTSIRTELSGSPGHIVRKHARDLYQYQNNPHFRQLLEQDGFRFVVITTSAQRADAIGAEAARLPWHPPTKTLAIPDLTLFV
jgi:hypothetical protein